METPTSAELITKLEAPSWFSGMKYMERDIHFILKLLSAPVYKNVPNVYERLVIYKEKAGVLAKRLSSIQKEVLKFRDTLQNYPNEGGLSLDEYYYSGLKHFMDSYVVLDSEFLKTKYDIFGFLEAVLLPSDINYNKNEK